MKRKSLLWIAVFLLIILIGAISYHLLSGSGGTVAVISVDGEEYLRIDLSTVSEERDIDIDTKYGHNRVHIEPGAISVTEADCPDLVCVRQGKLTGGGIPIACVPHRLIIQIEGGEIDG